eukprot:13748421-Alexandrium_andersonii.AAC.1
MSEEQVERCIATHFQGFAKEDIETVPVNGLTLRDRIRADRRALPRGGRLGASYWQQLVAEYS